MKSIGYGAYGEQGHSLAREGYRYAVRLLLGKGRRGDAHNPIHQWKDDIVFKNLYKQSKSFTLNNELECYILYQCALQTARIPGEVAEVGVFTGGTTRLLASILPHKMIHGFDTFTGMPKTDSEHDLFKEGDLGRVSLAKVKNYLSDLPNIRLYPGFFPATAKSLVNKRFSLAHIDADIYKSIWDSCVFFYPRMVSGGIILFDDYGFITCPGAKTSVDRFFADKPEHPFYLPTGQAMVIKH